jgi:bacterioferritin-associated ferredoxin
VLYISLVRTSLNRIAPEDVPARGNARPRSLPAIAPSMTRCECAGVTFDEIGRMLEAGEPLPAALARTGCAGMCTACGPDLESFLASRWTLD